VWKRYDSYITGGAEFSPFRGGQIINEYNWNFGIAEQVVLGALDSVTPHGSLADFGNISMYPEENRDVLRHAESGTDATNGVEWSSSDKLAFVMTATQIEYWNTVPLPTME
jgi:hypothetical protein